jgi:hypothetical protein
MFESIESGGMSKPMENGPVSAGPGLGRFDLWTPAGFKGLPVALPYPIQ